MPDPRSAGTADLQRSSVPSPASRPPRSTAASTRTGRRVRRRRRAGVGKCSRERADGEAPRRRRGRRAAASAASVVRQLPGADAQSESCSSTVPPSSRPAATSSHTDSRRRLGAPVAAPGGPEHGPHPEPARGQQPLGRQRAVRRPVEAPGSAPASTTVAYARRTSSRIRRGRHVPVGAVGRRVDARRRGRPRRARPTSPGLARAPCRRARRTSPASRAGRAPPMIAAVPTGSGPSSKVERDVTRARRARAAAA